MTDQLNTVEEGRTDETALLLGYAGHFYDVVTDIVGKK